MTSIKIMPGVSLPARCFSSCDQLSVVYNLNKCSSIGDYALSYCSSLQNIDISSCSELGEYVFYGCTNLTTVRLKPGIALKDCAFLGCSNLETVYNLNKCTSIGSDNKAKFGVFEYCYKLRNNDISECTFIGQ